MAQNYVQFLNVGTGIINNTREVESWNINQMAEEALMLDNEERDIRIIGFRFYDMNPETGEMLKSSGIYYMGGELFVFPKVDAEVSAYIKTTNKEFKKGEQLIKLKKPFLLVYPYQEGDSIVNIAPLMEKVKSKKAEVQLVQVKKEVEEYKHRLIEELRKIEDAIESNSFNRIPLTDSLGSDKVKKLNILDDQGNFNKHVEYLRNQRVILMKLENTLKGI